MRKIQPTIKMALLLLCVTLSACNGFLEEKPNKSWVVPTKLKDLQAILDNTNDMNRWVTPVLGELGSDDLFLDVNDWRASSLATYRNAYVWAADIFENSVAGGRADWEYPYSTVFRANLVLEKLEDITPSAVERDQWSNIKGSALFFKAWAYYQLAQEFCKPFDPTTANDDLGIPLREHSDINEKSSRASVQETYDEIIHCLQEAEGLLPITASVATRPSKKAVYALLAKTFLVMGRYQEAETYAERCLQRGYTLLNFNEIDRSVSYPFTPLNEETIFYNVLLLVDVMVPGRMQVSDDLLDLYRPGDLRKEAFFYESNGRNVYKGSYTGSLAYFSGITAAEILLIKTECAARLGKGDEAVTGLKELSDYRYESLEMAAIPASSDQDGLLEFVLDERRRELAFRGIRWSDLRRINREPKFAKTLSRQLDTEHYELLPNDLKYVLPIPEEVIEMNGMIQNPR